MSGVWYYQIGLRLWQAK